MQTRQPGTLTNPNDSVATHAWATDTTGGVYPLTPARALPGIWTSDGTTMVPVPNPSEGSDNDPNWDELEGTIIPTATYTVAGAVDQVPTGTKNGSNKVFTLSAAPVSIDWVFVELRGVLLTKTTDFTLSTATLTLAAGVTAPAATDSFKAQFWPAA